jgi:hypothetical protein
VTAARFFLSAALLVGPAAPALASFEPAAPLASRWHLDGATDRCVLTRQLEGPAGAATFALRTFPGSGRYEVILAGNRMAERIGRRADARIGFTGGPDMVEVAVSGVDLPGQLGRGLLLGPVGRGFVESFAKGSAFRLAGKDGSELGSWTIPSGAKAAEAMSFCEVEKQVEWGADRAGFAPGATPPRASSNPRTWVTVRDFGLSQAYTSALYTAVFRMNVNENGRAEGCKLIEYAGNVPEAKTRLCNALMSSARFEPARDAAGKPVRSVFTDAITIEKQMQFR